MSTAMTPVIFDLDGTLIDSVPDIALALNKVLAGCGAAPFSEPEVKAFVGNGLADLVASAMRVRGLDMADHAALTAQMLETYKAAPSALTRIYPGVEEALALLKASGHKLGLCTNKTEAAALLILEDLGLRHWFDAVVGGGRLPALKPDPAMLRLCMAELGAANAIYVGDSEVDAATALAADLPFLLYTEGYRKTAAEDLPQTAAFQDWSQLPWLVAEQG